jgi:WD40 repeat protein
VAERAVVHSLASDGDDHAAKLWDVKTGHCIKTIKGHTNSVMTIALSPDGYHLASGYEDQNIRLWNLSTEQCVETLRGHSNRIWSVTFNPQSINEDNNIDEITLASGSADRTIKLWNVQTGHCFKTLLGHSNSVWQVNFSPDGQHLVSCSFDQTVKLWDVSTGTCLKTFEGHTGAVASVIYSPDHQHLISCGFDQTIRIWHVVTGECIQILKGHTGIVSTLVCQTPSSVNTENLPQEISSQAAFPIFSGSFDETIKRWNLETRSCLSTLRVPRPYEGMNISYTTGLNEAQRTTLRMLGAVDDKK